MEVVILPILFLIKHIINLLIYCVVIDVIISWLALFDIINMYSKFIMIITSTLDKILTPILTPIRNFVPSLGGLDLSPVLLILCLQCLSNMVELLAHKF